MQIVIDIPEDVIECAKSSPNYYPTYHFEKIWRAIAKGTVLPKGHGRLVDADDIALIDEQFYTPSDYYVAESAINDAPTIIEANKAEGSEVKE